MRRLLFFLLFSASLFAQSKAGPFTLNASTSPCAIIGATANATVGIQVTGTFSATLQPEVSIAGQSPQNSQVTPSTSSTLQSTITTAGIYSAGVGGYDSFLLCVSAYSSGTATVYLTATPVISANGIVTSGGGAPVNSPAFTGIPTGPTAAAFSNSNQLATTAYVDNNFKGVSVAGFRDDFMSFSNLASIATTGTEIISDTEWRGFGIGSAGANTAGGNGTSTTFIHPGVYGLETNSGATTGQGVVLTKVGGTVAAVMIGKLGANAGWEFNYVFWLPSAANISMRAGFTIASGQTADPPTAGFWVRYDTGASDTDFTFETRSASTSTISASAVAGDTNWHHIRIRSITAGTILFSIDGSADTSIATHVDTGEMAPFIQLLTRTTATKQINIDFVSYMVATGRT
jgi:hypothetical protein